MNVGGRSAGCAIVGFAARFPGGVTARHFWEVLEDQGTLIRRVTDARRALLYPNQQPADARRDLHGVFLDGVGAFDRRLFTASPQGAGADPRERLLLDTCWTAMDDAGLHGATHGVDVGVFNGQDAWYDGPRDLAKRISAALGLRGPSFAFHAACSSVYVAIDAACAALERHECEAALVGGITVFQRPPADRRESPTHAMRSFSAGADGYVSSEGCGAFVLRRHDATAERRHSVYGVVRASGCDASEATTSSGHASRDRIGALIARTLAAGRLRAEQIGYVEAHGIASLVPDAIEANALIDVFGAGPRREPCHVSTVKPNVGHAHAASGVYALVKALLALRYGKIPAIRGLAGSELNRDIENPDDAIRFATDTVDWPARHGESRHILLPSFGLGNVNATLVIAELAPVRHERRRRTSENSLPAATHVAL